MTRTVKGTTMNVVEVANGKPNVRPWTFNTRDKTEIGKICKKKAILPIFETAKFTDTEFYVDDDIFFQIAEVKRYFEIEAIFQEMETDEVESDSQEMETETN